MAALVDLTFLTTSQLQELQATLATSLLESGGLYRVAVSSGDVSVSKSSDGMPLDVLIRSVSYELGQRGLGNRTVHRRTRVQFS
jgi:hypothetical protein